MENKEGNEILKNTTNQIEKVSQQLAISNKIIIQSDKYYKKITNEFTIRKAIKLARYARLIVDGYYDPSELDRFDENHLYALILNRFSTFETNFTPCKVFYLPKNISETRIAFYIPFEEYCVRFIIGIVLYEEYKDSFFENVFGGKEDLFSFRKNSSFSNFLNWQKRIYESKEYEYLYCLDIKSFFDSINQDALIESIQSKININENEYFFKLIKASIKFNYKDSNANIKNTTLGIIVGSAVDGFFQNVVLHIIDNIIIKFSNVEYGRLTDDIKIFCKTKKDGEDICQIIKIELLKFGLKLNDGKTHIYHLSVDEIVFEDSAYSDATSFIDIEDNYEIIKDGLSYLDENSTSSIEVKESQNYLVEGDYNNFMFFYDQFVFTDLAAEDHFEYAVGLLNIGISYWNTRHLESLLYIIKHRHTSWRMCSFFVNTFFKVASKVSIDRCAKETINLLTDSTVNSYSKYRILRNLFLDNYKYYTDFKNSEFDMLISDQLKLQCNSQQLILKSTAEFILKKYSFTSGC